MSQRALGQAVGASEQAVVGWLRHGTKPNADNLLRMADEFGISLDRLMGRVVPGVELLEQVTEQTRPIVAAMERLVPDRSIVEAVAREVAAEQQAQDKRRAQKADGEAKPGRRTKEKKHRKKNA